MRTTHEKNKNKHRSKKHFNDPIKNCANITATLLKAAQNLKVMKFKFDEEPLHQRVYLLSFMDSL